MSSDKPKKKRTLIIWLILFLGLAGLILYNVWDNHRVIVVEQDVAIQNLPPAFEGFKILVLSDLHSKRFGEQQSQLLQQIDALPYDAVFIAGDMQDRETAGFEPLLELLRGLPDEKPVYYVSGNWGPFDTDPITGDILDAGKVLQAEGVELLTLPIKIERDADTIWFVPAFSFSENSKLLVIASEKVSTLANGSTHTYYAKTLKYQLQLLDAVSSIPNEDVLIGLMHIPLPKAELDDLSDHPPYDLILAGHYHGGQIRLPLIGALYVPDQGSFHNGLFPDNKYISGLYIGSQSQQYISRGLGATSIIPLLKFRLFNTPEINLITLKDSVE